MGLMILFAILSQSIHAIEHLAEQFSEKKCHHVYQHHHTELHHGHDGLEKCFVCEFAFSNFISPGKQSFTTAKEPYTNSYSAYYSKEITQFFRGSLFALRAPPSCIV